MEEVFSWGRLFPTEFSDLQVKPLSDKEKTEFAAIGNKSWSSLPADKAALRQKQRSEYTLAKITSLAPSRTIVPLDGHWLFMPDYHHNRQTPVQINYEDRH